MPERRVGITGLGVVSPAGIGAAALWEAMLGAKCCAGPVERFDASAFPATIAAEVKDFSARQFVPRSYRKAVKVMARDIEIAVAAADLAVRDAGLVTRGVDPANTNVDSTRFGCNIGAGLICTDLDELGSAVNTAVVDGRFDLKAWGRGGMNNLMPLWLLKYLPNMLSCHVTIIHGAEGPSNTITCGDASSHMAVGEASRVIERGCAEIAIAGGAESKVNPMGLLRQALLKRLCTDRNNHVGGACRPFDAEHDGTVVGEGGGLVILEDIERAESRGPKVYAEVAGFAAACDPAGIEVQKANAGGLDLAIQRALADAGISPDEVDVIVAHGTGVAEEDLCEARAWRSALGEAAHARPAVAVTGSIGSLFAGAGGVEIALAAMMLAEQKIPPTANFSAAAQGCELSLSSSVREGELRYAVTGAFTVGGQSAACVLKRYEA